MTVREREEWLKGPSGISSLLIILKRYATDKGELGTQYDIFEAAKTLAKVDGIWMPKTTELEKEQAIKKAVQALNANPPSKLDPNAPAMVIRSTPRPDINALNKQLSENPPPDRVSTMRHADQPIPFCPEELVARAKQKKHCHDHATALYKERFGHEPLYLKPSTS